MKRNRPAAPAWSQSTTQLTIMVRGPRAIRGLSSSNASEEMGTDVVKRVTPPVPLVKALNEAIALWSKHPAIVFDETGFEIRPIVDMTAPRDASKQRRKAARKS